MRTDGHEEANILFSQFYERAVLRILEKSCCQEPWKISSLLFHLVLPDLITFLTVCEEWKTNIKT